MKKKRYVPDYKHLFGYKPGSQHFTFVAPTDFLRLAASIPESEMQRGLPPLRERMEKSRPLDALFLDVRSDTCEVFGHEGRHRAVAAREAGIDKLPLIIYCHGPNYRYAPVEECTRCLRDWRTKFVPESVAYARRKR